MRALTIVQKKIYFKNKGMQCPMCESINADSYSHTFDYDKIYTYCKCEDCKAKWTDTYVLKNVELDAED